MRKEGLVSAAETDSVMETEMALAAAGVAVPLPNWSQRIATRQALPEEDIAGFIFMPQPCLPSRRQQAGSLVSVSEDSKGIASETLKRASSKMAEGRCKP